MLYPVHWGLSLLVSALRLGAGSSRVVRGGDAPMPTLYEFEACPWCRIAREAVSQAGISVLVRPCPKGGTRYRPEVSALGGKAQFPYLVDGATGQGNYESGDIARQICTKWRVKRPLVHWLGVVSGILSTYAALLRLGFGVHARAARAQDKPLEFWARESSPSGRLVKEKLCVLEMEYIWHSGGGGKPRLFDANTDQTVMGARAILGYLNRTYKA